MAQVAYTKKDKTQFIKELRKSPLVGEVCQKLEIARATYYRWRERDAEFARKCDEALRQSSDAVSDLAESRLIAEIGVGNMKAITFWLTRRNPNYMDPLKRMELEMQQQRLQHERDLAEQAKKEEGAWREQKALFLQMIEQAESEVAAAAVQPPTPSANATPTEPTDSPTENEESADLSRATDEITVVFPDDDID